MQRAPLAIPFLKHRLLVLILTEARRSVNLSRIEPIYAPHPTRHITFSLSFGGSSLLLPFRIHCVKEHSRKYSPGSFLNWIAICCIYRQGRTTAGSEHLLLTAYSLGVTCLADCPNTNETILFVPRLITMQSLDRKVQVGR
jgi:hypothetical protein